MNTTYSKLRDGSWGLRGSRLTEGATVEVTKRDGTVKAERVGRVIWTGGDGTSLAAIATNGSGNGHRGQRRGRSCSCDDDCCSRGCQCESHCNCRGGNIYDC